MSHHHQLLLLLLQEMISESELDVLESKLRAGLHKLYNSRPMECYAAMDPRGTGSVSAAGIRYGISSCSTELV
jgi:hypothetical protein